LKKILFILIFLNINLFSSENYELKLYEKILPIIFKTDRLIVYTDKYSQEIFKNSKVFSLVSSCEKATIIIGKNFEKSCQKKPLFSTSYRSFENSKNSFGVFYWRNGVPNIMFNSKNIKRFHLFLPQSLKKYEKQ